PCAIAVLDTHVLLHYRLFDEVDWPTLVGAKPVRLVVPLRVVEELDERSTRGVGSSLPPHRRGFGSWRNMSTRRQRRLCDPASSSRSSRQSTSIARPSVDRRYAPKSKSSTRARHSPTPAAAIQSFRSPVISR